MPTCKHGVEYDMISMCSKCAEKYTVKTFQQPDDFRSHTCGECAWAMEHNGHLYCRRAAWGLYRLGTNQCYAQISGFISEATDACPAFVPREKGATK